MRHLAFFSLTVLLAGCGTTPAPLPPAAARVHVAAATYPLAFLAERIAADAVRVDLLTPPGTEPHDFEPTPQDVARMQDADLLLINGGGLDNWAAQIPLERTVRVSLFDQIQRAYPTEQLLAKDDPHAWLDPRLMRKYADEVKRVITEEVPGQEQVLRMIDQNDQLTTDLERLENEFGAGLTACRTRTVITSHDAFGYLGRRYGLKIVPIAGLSPEEEPSPAQLAKITKLAKQAGVTTVFTEPLTDTRLSNTIARELGLQTAVLNPIEGLTEAERAAGEDYFSLMRKNLQALRTALHCE